MYVTKVELYFTPKIHHGGDLIDYKNKRLYVGGIVTYHKDCDMDRMSVLEIRCISRDIGYIEPPKLYIKVPGDDKILYLQDDGVLMACLEKLGSDQTLEVYFKHVEEFQPFGSQASFGGYSEVVELVLSADELVLADDKVGFSSEINEDGDSEDKEGDWDETEFDTYSEQAFDTYYEQDVEDKEYATSVDPNVVFDNLNKLKEQSIEKPSVGDDIEESETIKLSRSNEAKRKLPKYSRFRSEIDMSNPQFKLGLSFAKKDDFIKVVKKYIFKTKRK